MSEVMARTEPSGLVLQQGMSLGTIERLFEKALERGEGGVDALAKLVDLYDRVRKQNAELAFSTAFAEFQMNCPAIERTSQANIKTGAGTDFSYTYADLEEIIETVRPHLSAHGLSFSFDSNTDKDSLTCFCTLRHSEGHSIRAQFSLPTASSSPSMSEQQKVAGAMTLAKRQVLISVLGLSLTDPDPDAKVDPTPIGADQIANIEALMDETKSSRTLFCAHFNIGRVLDLRTADYGKAVTLLEKKRKAPR